MLCVCLSVRHRQYTRIQHPHNLIYWLASTYNIYEINIQFFFLELAKPYFDQKWQNC